MSPELSITLAISYLCFTHIWQKYIDIYGYEILVFKVISKSRLKFAMIIRNEP